MNKLLAAIAGFVLAPVVLAWFGALPAFNAGPVTPTLIGAGLLLAGLMWRALFERLVAALLAGGLAGAAAGAVAAMLTSTGGTPIDAAWHAVALAVTGAACAFVAHALFVALDASASGATSARGFVYRPLRPARAVGWLRPFVHAAALLHDRHPARLKLAYRRFHVAVSWLSAAVWLALLWAAGTAARQHAGGDIAAWAASGIGAVLLAVLVLALAVLAAFAAWWAMAAACLTLAVRSGTLPPFGTARYLRSGRFPSHWIANEHAFIALAEGEA